MRTLMAVTAGLALLQPVTARAATIAAGQRHSLLVTPSGSVWVWGDNGKGQLGLHGAGRMLPALVPGLEGATQVAAGSQHSLVLRRDGTVWVFGSNEQGQLGVDAANGTGKPIRVSGLSEVAGIAAGDAYSLAWTGRGELFAWGANDRGQLGLGDREKRSRPTRVEGVQAAAAAAGSESTFVLTLDGGVLAFGRNDASQLGLGHKKVQLSPAVVSGLESIVSVVAGSSYGAALDRGGVLRVWGAKAQGPTGMQAPLRPEPVGALTPTVVAIAAGREHILAITTAGSLWAWGGNSRGQLGQGGRSGGEDLVQIVVPHPVASAAAGASHTIVVTREGGVWAWGANDAGQIGDGSRDDSLEPTETAEAGYDWKVGRPALVPPGGRYDAAQSVTVSSATPDAQIHYTTDGQEPNASDPAVASGGLVEVAASSTVKARAVKPPAPSSNTTRARYDLAPAGTVPSETGAPELAPRKSKGGRGGDGMGTTALVAGENVGYGAVAGGLGHSLLLKPDGTVWSWGSNFYFELGDTNLSGRDTPAQVAGLSNIKAIDAGYGFSLALQSNGDLWVWGLNSQGQLGDGLTASRSVPYKVMTGVAAMSAGETHVLALTSSGAVWAWGRNNEGELGLGTTSTTPQRTPIQVPGFGPSPSVPASGVAAGENYSMAIVASNGTVRAWGYNGYGQLGQGDLTQRSTPTTVIGINAISALAAGDSHALALRSDGQVFGWGLNTYGQVGDGTSGTSRQTPVQLLECPPVVSISAGLAHSLAISETGVVYGWGQQSNGQVGDGTTGSARPSPVALDAPSDIASIDAGTSHSLAISRDGSVWAWGINSNGQLGDGTKEKRIAPVKIAEAGFSWLVGAPTFNPGQLNSGIEIDVTMTASTAGAEIRYTTNGSEPTAGSTLLPVPPNNKVHVAVSATLKAKAFKAGQPPSSTTSGYFQLIVVPPNILPTGGTTFTSPQTVSITTTTSGAEIHYTTDGLAPTELSPLYTSPFIVSTKTTVNATAYKTGWTSSDGSPKTYGFNYGTATAPTVTPATGSSTDSVTVSMSAQAGATIRYTTDGSAPGPTSTPYTAPLVLTATTTINAKAFHPDYLTSVATTRVYTINLSAPILTPGAGTYSIGQSVTLSAAAGTTVRYTMNGAAPTSTDTGVPSGTTVRLVATSTLKAAAFRTGATASTAITAAYTVTGSVPNVAVDGGLGSSMAKLPTGGLWAWGSNLQGQLGDGTTTDSLVPKLLTTPSSVTQATAGWRHTLSVDASVARSWGGNVYGELGYATASSSPLPVSSLSATVTQVAAGQYLSLAVLSDTNVWAWGRNNSGQLGNNTTNSVANSTPVHVKDPPGTSFLSGVTSVAAGLLHSVALKSDGTVYAWGSNTNGQVGQTSGTTQKSLPIQVTGFPAGTTVLAIAAGDYHTLALLSDGTVYGWGSNQLGQLGNGATASFNNVPVRCGTLTGARAIAAGGQHSLVALKDGSVFVFGSNSDGQIGIAGVGLTASSPLRLDALSGVATVGAGVSHSLAVDVDGQIWSWGRNADGQLGDGTQIARPTPVRVADTSYNWLVGTPTLTPSGAAFYNDVQSVTVASATTGAEIYYTTNGVDPTTSDSHFTTSGIVNVGVSLTLKAKAFKAGLAPSSVSTAVYPLKVAAIAPTPPGGVHNTPQTVSLASASPSPTIYYTTDGSTPTTSSPVYGTPIAVNASMTIRAQGYKAGWDSSSVGVFVYTMTVVTPVVSPMPGSFSSPQTVTATSATPLAIVHYTLDGSTPNETSAVAPGGGIPVTESAILSVKAFRSGWNESGLTTGVYVINTGAVATPTFNPAAGSYGDAQTVSIVTATPASAIRYTLDGTDPTPASLLYTGLVTVDATTTLRARAYKADAAPSAIASAAYTISAGSVVAPPTFSPPGGYYTTQRTVTLTSATGGAIIHYTTDGSVPSPSSASVASGGTIVVGQALRLRAKAYAAGYPASPAPSPVRQADYRITGAVAAGSDGALALKTDGTLYSWGSNNQGTVGNGTTTPVTNPTAVATMTNVIAIASGAYYGVPTVGESFAVKADNSLWAWGSNTSGQLGIGNVTSPQKSPVQVKEPAPGPGFLTGVAAVSSGYSHALALTTSGQVYGWGLNAQGQTGLGTTVSPRTTPVLVGITDVIAIAAGARHSVALKRDGTVWVWGYNFGGLLGTGSATSPVLTPTQVAGISNVVAIAAGTDVTLAIRADDSVTRSLWTWGDGAGGKLLDSSSELRTAPGKVGSGVAVSAASAQSLVYRQEVTGRGMIWGAGVHFADALSTGAMISSTVPVHVAEGEFLAMSAGGSLSAAIKPDLTLLVWGLAGLGGNAFSLGNAGAFTADPDGDGLTTAREWEFGTDPFNSDTNGDGIPDGMEVAAARSPTNPDIDGDGVLNTTERANGTNPFSADTDGDGYADGVDCFPLDPTRWQCPQPVAGDVTPPVITLTEPTNAILQSSTPP